jgi:hypothetical protein
VRWTDPVTLSYASSRWLRQAAVILYYVGLIIIGLSLANLSGLSGVLGLPDPFGQVTPPQVLLGSRGSRLTFFCCFCFFFFLRAGGERLSSSSSSFFCQGARGSGQTFFFFLILLFLLPWGQRLCSDLLLLLCPSSSFVCVRGREALVTPASSSASAAS